MLAKTFAAIDIGSYELSMKIFEVSKRRGMRQIDHIRHMIDMGTETYAKGLLSYERVEELCNILKEFQTIMKSYRVSDYKAYGTSAIRETKNTAILIDQIEQKTGIHIDVLSNSEQRFLDYKSIAFRGEKFESLIEKGTVILDIGGGSIQLSLFDKNRLISTQNLKLGVLRILERMNTLGVSMRQYDKLIRELVDAQLSTYKKLYLKDRTVENMILVDDHVSLLLNKEIKGSGNDAVMLSVIEKYIDMVEQMGKSQVAKTLSMSEDDIPLLFISLLLTQEVMSTIGAESIWAPGVTLSDGIAYEFAEKSENITTNHDFEADIISCAKQISKRYLGSNSRSETLRQIALNIFDSTKEIHGLSHRDRLLLLISTLLHDCGKYISMVNLAECSYNIIRYTEIIGLSHRERMIIANVVKYNQEVFEYFDEVDGKENLSAEDHMKVAKLTAILRLANGLDRSHKKKFIDVEVEAKNGELLIFIKTDEDITLEKGLFGNRAAFFEEVYNLKPIIKQKRSF